MFLLVNRLTISFCIPTHGRTRPLLEALESSLTQTRLPDEIVVSDLRDFIESHVMASTRRPILIAKANDASDQALN